MPAKSAQSIAHASSSWTALLRLEFDHVDGITRLARRRHRGPLLVQKPFYPDGADACHVYLVHPPGGVVGGDQLALQVTLQPDSNVLLTTVASTKFYKSAGPYAKQTQRIIVKAGALCEWMPQETLLFDGARVDTRTIVRVDCGGQFAGWEILCFGRPACRETFDSGEFQQRFELWRDGVPLILEALCVSHSNKLVCAPFGLDGKAVTGSMLLTADSQCNISELAEVTRAEQGLFGITRVRNAVVCRYLGNSCAEARSLFIRVWKALSCPLFGRQARPPRIWAT